MCGGSAATSIIRPRRGGLHCFGSVMKRDAVITIIRNRRRSRFVSIDQKAVDDERLSWAARGLLHYLLARPDDWKVLVKDLQRRGDLKRDGIYGLLKELRNTG